VLEACTTGWVADSADGPPPAPVIRARRSPCRFQPFFADDLDVNRACWARCGGGPTESSWRGSGTLKIPIAPAVASAVKSRREIPLSLLALTQKRTCGQKIERECGPVICRHGLHQGAIRQRNGHASDGAMPSKEILSACRSCKLPFDMTPRRLRGWVGRGAGQGEHCRPCWRSVSPAESAGHAPAGIAKEGVRRRPRPRSQCRVSCRPPVECLSTVSITRGQPGNLCLDFCGEMPPKRPANLAALRPLKITAAVHCFKARVVDLVTVS